MLLCTAGEGWYQEEGKEAVSLSPGTVITIKLGEHCANGSVYVSGAF